MSLNNRNVKHNSPLHKSLLSLQSRYVLDVTTLGICLTVKLTLCELYAKTWQVKASHDCLLKPLMSHKKDNQRLLDDKSWHAECLNFSQEPMPPQGLSLGRNVNLCRQPSGYAMYNRPITTTPVPQVLCIEQKATHLFASLSLSCCSSLC